MFGVRVSVSGMVGLVAISCFALACLINASALVAGLVHLLFFALLATAPLGVVYRRRERRAFWLGFSVWGWSFLAITSLPNAFALFEVAVIKPVLTWAYPRVVSEWRRWPNQRLQKVEVPIAFLAEGERFEDLGTLVDLRENGTEKPNAILEAIEVVDARVAGNRWIEESRTNIPSAARLTVLIDAGQAKELERVTARARKLRVIRHKTGLSTVLRGPLSVDRGSFDQVGHALAGLLVGLAGAALGRMFYQSRNSEVTYGTRPMGNPH
jgi:hypothetical protein